MNKTDELAIDLSDITKTYRRRVHALRGIEMRIHRGEIFGLLGPNGAGKSTLVKIIMTIVRPLRAEGTVLGRPIGHKPTLARIGYLPEHPRFVPYLTGRQTLEFYAAMAKVDRRTRKRRAAELLELVDMTEWADARVRTYSKGMNQRIGLAQTLISDPDMILLDEPAEGLDPIGRYRVRQILLDLRNRGKTIFVNSHLLGELEMICQRIAILVTGKVVRQGSLDELTRANQYYQIELHLDQTRIDPAAISRAISCTLHPSDRSARPKITPGPSPTTDKSDADGSAVEVFRGELQTGRWIELQGPCIRVEGADPQCIQPVIDALRQNNLIIRSVQPVRQSLEDLFVETVTSLPTNKPAPSTKTPTVPQPPHRQTSAKRNSTE